MRFSTVFLRFCTLGAGIAAQHTPVDAEAAEAAGPAPPGNHVEARDTWQREYTSKAWNYCGDSDFQDHTDQFLSPLASDCSALADAEEKYPGRFYASNLPLEGGNYKVIANQGSCRFAVKNMDGQKIFPARVSNSRFWLFRPLASPRGSNSRFGRTKKSPPVPS